MEKIIILLICITIALVIMIYTIANIRKIRKEFNEAKNDLLKMISEHEYLALKETTQDGELRVLPDWTQQETTNNFKNFLKKLIKKLIIECLLKEFLHTEELEKDFLFFIQEQ